MTQQSTSREQCAICSEWSAEGDMCRVENEYIDTHPSDRAWGGYAHLDCIKNPELLEEAGYREWVVKMIRRQAGRHHQCGEHEGGARPTLVRTSRGWVRT